MPRSAREGEAAFSEKMPEGIGCKVQSTPKFAAFESPQALRASIPTPFGPSGHSPPDRGNRPLETKGSLRGWTVRRGRCRSQPFATKERYGCGSAACRYTSTRQFAPFLRKSPANSRLPNGPTESSAPTTTLALSCRGGRLCPPADRTGFYGNLRRIRGCPAPLFSLIFSGKAEKMGPSET